MTGEDFQNLLKRLIGADEAARCIRKICRVEHLDLPFFGGVTNAEAVALYVYATANGWHTLINSELWSGTPGRDVVLFAEVLNAAIAKIPAIRGKAATVYRGYSASDLTAFGNHYPLGQIVRFPAFTSASFSASGAFGGNVLFIIRALSARSIWPYSPNFHEEEALLPTNCSFRIADKEVRVAGSVAKQLVIVLEEVLGDS